VSPPPPPIPSISPSRPPTSALRRSAPHTSTTVQSIPRRHFRRNSSRPPSPKPPSSSTTHGIRVRDALAALDPRTRSRHTAALARLQPDEETRRRSRAFSPGHPRLSLAAARPTRSASSASPRFDVAGYEQNGHLPGRLRIDTPWVPDPPPPNPPQQPPKTRPRRDRADPHPAERRKAPRLHLLVEKNCGISSRLLWTESGKPLAEKTYRPPPRVHNFFAESRSFVLPYDV